MFCAPNARIMTEVSEKFYTPKNQFRRIFQTLSWTHNLNNAGSQGERPAARSSASMETGKDAARSLNGGRCDGCEQRAVDHLILCHRQGRLKFVLSC